MNEASEKFKKSLIAWGGWSKLIYHDPKALATDLRKTISDIGRAQQTATNTKSKLTNTQWQPIANVLPIFLNAYLQQELARIVDGPNEIITPLRLTNDSNTALLILALVVIAREHGFKVEIVYECPYGEPHEAACKLSSSNQLATIFIHLNYKHADENFPLLLSYEGEEFVLDKQESTPKNPVWCNVPVDRKAAIFFDGLIHAKTLDQQNMDDFITKLGWLSFRFSAEELSEDLFKCATAILKSLTGKEIR